MAISYQLSGYVIDEGVVIRLLLYYYKIAFCDIARVQSYADPVYEPPYL